MSVIIVQIQHQSLLSSPFSRLPVTPFHKYRLLYCKCESAGSCSHTVVSAFEIMNATEVKTFICRCLLLGDNVGKMTALQWDCRVGWALLPLAALCCNVPGVHCAPWDRVFPRGECESPMGASLTGGGSPTAQGRAGSCTGFSKVGVCGAEFPALIRACLLLFLSHD